jgi:hypothetical protein
MLSCFSLETSANVVQPSTDLTGTAGPKYGVPRDIQVAVLMSYVSHSDHARGGMCRCWSVQNRGVVPTCDHTIASRTKIAFREGEQLGRNALALWGQCMCHGALRERGDRDGANWYALAVD